MTLLSLFKKGMIICALLSFSFGSATADETGQAFQVGGVSFQQILQRLGAQLEQGLSFEQHQAYIRQFDFADADHDGRHSVEEYVEKGIYGTTQVRQGIFRAADENGDGWVTRAEYVMNRVITDEAKSMLQKMDDDRNVQISKIEFLSHTASELTDPLSETVFNSLDTDGNGSLIVREYLRVWGTWARAGQKSAEARLAALREQELDAFWAEVSRSVKEGDFQGYAATCHSEGVLVSGSSGASYPLSRALVRWEKGILETQSGEIKASVEFRFGQRLGDATTAHETGIFRYETEKDGEVSVFLIHLEALLVKKNQRWQVLMEYQKSEASEEEWEALEHPLR